MKTLPPLTGGPKTDDLTQNRAYRGSTARPGVSVEWSGEFKKNGMNRDSAHLGLLCIYNFDFCSFVTRLASVSV